MFRIEFKIDGLTEEERWEVITKLDLIRDKVCDSLEYDWTALHRQNRVWIKQDLDISFDEAILLYKLLCNVRVNKAYDEYYDYGQVSQISVSLTFTDDMTLDDERALGKEVNYYEY